MPTRIAWSLLAVAAACGPKTEPRPLAGSAAPTAGSATEPAGCNDAHDCTLRSKCGCSCEAVLVSAPRAEACDESCNNPRVCDNHTVICDLASHRCGAIPKPP